MKPIVTKNQIAQALFAGSGLFDGVCNLGGVSFNGVLSVEREDGSGKSFNVTGYNEMGDRITVCLQTID